MTVREQIVKLLQDAGYGVWEACEMADQAIRETPANSAVHWNARGVSFTVMKG